MIDYKKGIVEPSRSLIESDTLLAAQRQPPTQDQPAFLTQRLHQPAAATSLPGKTLQAPLSAPLAV